MPGDRRQILSLLRLPIPPLQLADDSSSQAALRTRPVMRLIRGAARYQALWIVDGEAERIRCE